MCRTADYYNQHPEIDSRQHYMECLIRNYNRILEKGTEQNPIPEKENGKRGCPKHGKSRTLIDRLRKYKGEACRFGKIKSVCPWKLLLAKKYQIKEDSMKKTRIAAAAVCALMLITPFSALMVQDTTIHASAGVIEDVINWITGKNKVITASPAEITYIQDPCQSLNYHSVSTSRVVWTRTAKYKDHDENHSKKEGKATIRLCKLCDHYYRYRTDKDHYVKIRNGAGETKTGTAKCGSTAKASIKGKASTSDKKFKIYWGISSGPDSFEHDKSFK